MPEDISFEKIEFETLGKIEIAAIPTPHEDVQYCVSPVGISPHYIRNGMDNSVCAAATEASDRHEFLHWD